MFDLLTYEKGASVLRMLEQYLGPDVFRDGVRRYLNAHTYGNAETGDLWKALGEASGHPIPAVMDTWIFRPGFPLVTVEPDGAGLKLSQRPFTYLEPDGPAEEATRWHVPITLRASVKRGYVEKRVMLSEAETQVTLPAKADWAVANAGGHGFYRVRYATPLLNRMTKSLAALQPIERFNIVSDALALAQAGLMPATEYLDLTGRFTAETDRNVWVVVTGSFGYVNRVIAESSRVGLEALVRKRVGPAAELLGWEPEPGESELTRQLRGDLLRAVGTLGNDPEVQERARALYARHLADDAPVDANVLPAVIAIIAACGGEQEYADFLQRFKSARTPQEEQRYLYALAGFRQPELIRQTLGRTINGEIRSQDAPFVIRSMLIGVYSRELAWSFVKEHWEAMARQYPGSAYRRMYEGVTALVGPAWEQDVRDFFPSRKIVLGGKTLEQYLEQLQIAVRFQERESTALAAHLAKPPRAPRR
jgi:puromycin-sensitive aminopeptidase